MKKEVIIEKITRKKEFSQLPRKDIELAFNQFNSGKYLEEEKIKLTRDLLRKVFSAFLSQKILSPKDKNPEWILRKHLSTRERLPHYKKIYQRLLKNLGKELSIIDLGAGINGFSYNYFKNLGFEINYLAIESVGQLVELMNSYFRKNKIKAKAFHLSLFEIDKVRQIIKREKKPRVIFLFKTIDSLEMLEKSYSKKFLLEIIDLAERVVISFATRSMIRKKKFKIKRTWILDFIKNNFSVLDNFEIGGEIYIVFSKRKKDL